MLEVYAVNYLELEDSKTFVNHFKNKPKFNNEDEYKHNEHLIQKNDIKTGLIPLRPYNVQYNPEDYLFYYKLKIKENCDVKLKLSCEFDHEKYDGDIYPILTIFKIEGIIDGDEVNTDEVLLSEGGSGFKIKPFHNENIYTPYIKNCGLFKHIEIKNDTMYLNGFVDMNLITNLSLNKKIDILGMLNNMDISESSDEEVIEELKKFRGILKFEIEHNKIVLNDFHNSSSILFTVDNVESLGDNKFELSIHNHSEINIIKHADIIPIPEEIVDDDIPTPRQPIDDDYWHNNTDNTSKVKNYYYNKRILKTKESTYEIKKIEVYKVGSTIYFSSIDGFEEGLHNTYTIILNKLFHDNPIEYKNFLEYFCQEKYIYDRHYQLYDTDENIKKIFKASSIFFKMIEIGIQILKKNIKLLENTNANNINIDPKGLRIVSNMFIRSLDTLNEIYNNLLFNKVGFESIIIPDNTEFKNLIKEDDNGVTTIENIKYNIMKIKKIE